MVASMVDLWVDETERMKVNLLVALLVASMEQPRVDEGRLVGCNEG